MALVSQMDTKIRARRLLNQIWTTQIKRSLPPLPSSAESPVLGRLKDLPRRSPSESHFPPPLNRARRLRPSRTSLTAAAYLFLLLFNHRFPTPHSHPPPLPSTLFPIILRRPPSGTRVAPTDHRGRRRQRKRPVVPLGHQLPGSCRTRCCTSLLPGPTNNNGEGERGEVRPVRVALETPLRADGFAGSSSFKVPSVEANECSSEWFAVEVEEEEKEMYEGWGGRTVALRG